MAQTKTLEQVIEEYGVDITPDNQIYIGSIGKTVPVPTDPRVNLASMIEGVVKADQRIKSGTASGEFPMKPAYGVSPADAAIDKIRSFGMPARIATDMFATGPAKGLANTSANLTRMAGLGGLTVTPEQQKEMTQASTIPQQVGKTAEQIGEFMAPGGAENAARTGLFKQAVKLPAGIDTVGMTMARMLPGAASAAGVAAAQGEDPKIAATLGAITPQMFAQIGRMAQANPEQAARLINAVGLGGIIAAPAMWEKFVSALGVGVGRDTVERLGQALQHVSINRPAGRAATGIGTRFLSSLEGYNPLGAEGSAPSSVSAPAASAVPQR